MSFYNYGQNVSSGLGDLIEGGEQGLTFGQGIRSMLQKRRLDAQKAGDEHAESGVKQAVDMKSAGIMRAPTPSPTTGGGPVSPLDDPTNQPRSDGATEMGGVTPVSTPGISNPTPHPGLMGKIGQGLHALSGMFHTNTGQNAGVHTTDAFVDRPGEQGKQLSERVNDASQSGENSRLATSEAGLTDRNRYTQGHEDSRNFASTQAEIQAAKIRAAAEEKTRGMAHADASTDRRIAMLQRLIANRNSVMHGWMGGIALSGPDKLRAQQEIDGATRELESLMGEKKGALSGFTGDSAPPPQGAPGQTFQAPGAQGGSSDIYQGFDPSLFGGPKGLPPFTDETYKQYLISIGRGPKR